MRARLAVLTGATSLIAGLAAIATSADSAGDARPKGRDELLVSAFEQVDRNTEWLHVDTVDLDFETFHPQAMEVVGDRIYLSSVEVIERPERYPEPIDGYDRSPGRGVGHVFVLDLEGNLLEDIEIADGHRYHPGGIDVHGDALYVPVAEYRPDSSSDIYRIDLQTYQVTRLFGVDDHIGGVVVDQLSGRLVGQSWGSRRFYEWSLAGKQKDFWLNENHFLDYQDCEYVASRKTLCSGVTGLAAPPGIEGSYELGGFAMIDLRDEHRILHEVPLQLWSTAGHVITRNPTDLDAEPTADGARLTLYAAPDDADEGAGTQVLVYTADVAP
ncbi:DUF6454 family protein [Phytoactinopolyspora halotolerans]|uniref:Uncharacterized protein n=1 Tax=Phytoactinopolyspora halotolerans TaxID=1981512 RepID=A0A6L9S7T8_9ACTN|nr:DUF6454 family protein [Phytoactinopolyspora halotolerans]NEE01097.1 hypothetical protein [Phytoactinopolyspora halotolerans]